MKQFLKILARKIIMPDSLNPVLGDKPYGGPENSAITFVMVCNKDFNINIPNANSTFRLGLCRGFAQIGVRFQLIGVQDIKKIISGLRKPFISLSAIDYFYLNKSDRQVISKHPHFIWVTPWFKDLEAVFARHNLPDPRVPRYVVRKILNSGANFVWSPVPPSCLKFYEEWQKHGQQLESILQACDTTRYYPQYEEKRYSDIIMAFVGGFWAYKNIQFEKYLKPYEDILTVFGYSPWPYQGYQGQLPEGDEKLLYQNGRLSPCISEPHAEIMGDIVERVYKVMGSGGLAITDVVPFYREVFSEEELLVPNSINEYHEMVRWALKDADLNQRYRQKGYQAILNGHTYRHRALTILRLLGIQPPE